MDKILRNSIGFALIVVSLSIAYYLVVYLPSKEQIARHQETLKILQNEERQQTEQTSLQAEKNALQECQNQLFDRLDNDKELKKTLSNIKGTMDDAQKFMNLYLETCMRNKGFPYK